MPRFWKVGNDWINVERILAVRESEGSHCEIILIDTGPRVPDTLVCTGEEARQLIEYLVANSARQP
jgi:hypothetical protein